MANLKGFLFGSCSHTSNCAQACYAVFRLCVGLSMALGHGWGKFAKIEGFGGSVESQLGLPMGEALAWFAALIEFVGGLAIAIGLVTRPFAMALGLLMLVAYIGWHAGAPYTGDGGGEKAALYLFACVLISSFGSGKYGVDDRLRR